MTKTRGSNAGDFLPPCLCWTRALCLPGVLRDFHNSFQWELGVSSRDGRRQCQEQDYNKSGKNMPTYLVVISSEKNWRLQLDISVSMLRSSSGESPPLHEIYIPGHPSRVNNFMAWTPPSIGHIPLKIYRLFNKATLAASTKAFWI